MQMKIGRGTVMCGYRVAGARSSPCNGDQGAPFMLDVDGRYEQIGVVSLSLAAIDGGGNQVCALGYPDFYSLVASFVGWIHEQIGDDARCSKNDG